VGLNGIRKAVGALAVGLLSVGLMGSPAVATSMAPVEAAPEVTAAAAATPAFEIFYSPGCTNASRVYSGQNFGEWWINDTFNRTASGGAGYRQAIRNNAASVWVSNASLYIASSANMQTGTPAFYVASAGGCFNLAPYGLRNNNAWWATMYYVP